VRKTGWALACLLGLAACAPRVASPVAATVNGEAISVADLDLEQRLAGPGKADANDLLDGLIDQTLILQEGRRMSVVLGGDALKAAEESYSGGTDDKTLAAGLAVNGVSLNAWRQRVDQAALADEVINQAIRSKVDIGRQEIQDYYWVHVTAFRSGDRKLLRQIFCRDRASAEAAMKQLHAGAAFADVAKRYGQAPEAAQGGLLDPMSRQQMPKALATATQKLKVGEISPIIRSPWGWHILRLEADQKEQADSLDQATPLAHARLLRDKEQILYQLWLEHLREQAKIVRLITQASPSAPKPGN
jgi:parvulin-like peptidyl-prolyl isomerase